MPATIVQPTLQSASHLRTPEIRLLRDLARRVSELYPGSVLTLFGSRARGDAGEDSDWDVLVELARPLQAEERIALLDEVYDFMLERDFALEIQIVPVDPGDRSRYGGLLRQVASEGLRIVC